MYLVPSTEDRVIEDARQDLDAQLLSRTYIVNNYLTAADIALYGALHPILVCSTLAMIMIPSHEEFQSQLQPAQYYSHPAVTRYFDHIQSAPSVRQSAESLAPAFSLVEFDVENAPKAERKAEPPKKKEKKLEQVAEAVSSAATSVKDKVVAALTDAKPTREKKDKKKDAGAADAKKAAKTPAVAEDAGEPVPSWIDLRVGHIVDGKYSLIFIYESQPNLCVVKKHPDADGLYIEVVVSIT